MSLRCTLAGAAPASTAMVAPAAFPRGNPYMRLRDTLGAVFADRQFAALFPSHRQPAEALWRLALVTLLLDPLLALCREQKLLVRWRTTAKGALAHHGQRCAGAPRSRASRHRC